MSNPSAQTEGKTAAGTMPSPAGRWALLAVGLVAIAALVWVLSRHATSTAPRADATPAPAPAPPSAAAVAPAPAAARAPGAGVEPSAQPDPVIVADTAFTACVVPTAPSELPDGATASFDAMRAARTAVTAYDSATTAYLNCLDTTAEQLAQQRQGAGAAAGLQALRSLQVSLHNTAVDTDHAVAERLNQQIRIYKAKHAP